MDKFFACALPVWTNEKRGEMNVTCLFSARAGKGKTKVRVTACNFYRMFVGGKFFGYGPARAARGYARVDEYEFELGGETTIVFEVAGYRCNTFYCMNEEPFLQAEILSDERVVKATGREGDFSCRILTERVQKVARFSYQRPFSESYVYRKPLDLVYGEVREPCGTEILPQRKLLPRGVSYPEYDRCDSRFVEYGTFDEKATEPPMRDRSLTMSELGIFPIAALETLPSDDLASFRYFLSDKENFTGKLSAGEYAVYSFVCSETGFLELSFTAKSDSHILMIFDEVDYREEKAADKPINVDFYRNSTFNIVEYDVAAGEFSPLCYEPYTAKYVKVIVTKGEIVLKNPFVLRYENPDCKKFAFRTGNEKADAVIDAAVRTFRHNAVDLLTDCPSRERAGWLCDSWFSAQAEKLFTGENKAENNLLENIALSGRQPNVPENMVPMCYPADFSEPDLFIPNWAMWYLVELPANKRRTGSDRIAKLSEEKVNGLLSYFGKFENEDGLLENLKGWIFVEWSKANDPAFVEGVNYPSNMLYALALDSVSSLYGRKELSAKAEKIRQKIRDKSFNGEFFEDNAVRKNGRSSLYGHMTETCQYYAFFTKTATREAYPKLWNKLLLKFGPRRDPANTYPEVYPSNAFIGDYLRLILLSEAGLFREVFDETIDYFYKMATLTGTLWEYDCIYGSLDHGFASFIAVLLVENYERCRKDAKKKGE